MVENLPGFPEYWIAQLNATHVETLRAMDGLIDAQILAPNNVVTGEETLPYWFGMMRLIDDTSQHAGQIAYLRGLASGIGWKKTLDWTPFATR